MDAACNFPELLALDLETAESLFASKRMTSGAPRPMDAIFESQSIQDLGLKLEDLNLNDLSLEEASSLLSSLGKLSQLNKLNKLNNPAAVAHASSPRKFLPGKTPSSSRQQQNRHQHQQSSRHDHHSRSKSTTHAAPSDLAAYLRQYQRHQEKQQHHQQQYHDDNDRFDDNDSLNLDDLRDLDLHSRLDQRPTTASGIDRDIGRDIDRSHSPGPVFSISRSKTKSSGQSQNQNQNRGHGASQPSSAVPRYAAGSGVTGVNTSAGSHNHNTAGGDWDTDSVDSFELPSIRLSRRSAEQRTLLGGVSKSPSLPSAAAPPVQSVHQRIQQQEEEQIQQLQQLKQLKQLRQLQQLKQQLQEKQQLQHLLEKQLKLQHEQEQTLKASHREAKEKESSKPRQKEQAKAKDTKEARDTKDRDCRKDEDDDTLSHLPQQPPTHLPATTQPSSSLLPQQRSQQQQTQQAQQQQNRLSVVDPLSDYGNRDSYSSLYDSYSYSHHRYSHDSNQSADTNTNTDDGASSIGIAGGGVGGGEGGDGAPRGRQQSVVTMATSVSGRESRDGCRFSSQSQASRTTPSALGQYSAPTKNGCLTVSSSQRESVATTASSADRHVEFSLDWSRRASTKATSDNTSASDEDGAVKTKAKAKTEEEDRDNDKEAALAVERPKSSAAKQLPPRRTGNVSQLSWMRFDDEEDEDDDDTKDKEDDVDRGQTYSDIIRGMNGVGSVGGRPQSRDGSTIDRSRGVVSPVNYTSLPPRPKTAVGHVDGASTTDFRALNDYVAERTRNNNSKKRQSRVTIDEATPAASINVPQRRSSLGQKDRKPLLFRENDDEQQNHSHKLRHFLSFSDASVFSDAPRGGLHDRPKTSSSSHYQMQSDFGLGFASAAASERERERRSRFETESIADHEDPPVFLQKTVYRKPVPRPRTPLDMTPIKKAAAAAHKSTPSAHLTRRGREVFSVSRGGNAKDDGASTNNGGADQPFVEPLLVSQFDDDSDSDHHPGAPASDHGNNNDDDMDIDAHLAENDAELFGDFEGAYNYDEGQDKIMLATMIPFSKQPPRSVRSIRSVSPGRPLDTLPDVHERPAIASIAALTAVESPEETSSHLQSWIEHASKSQLELLQQQQEQKEKEQQHLLQQRSRSSASCRAQEAFYEDDENDEARDVVAEAIQAPTTRPRTGRNDGSAASTAEPASTGQYELQNALQQAQPVPLQFFAQPGTVGIPLPREVVETLRVSVSCFPETMLSLSSFSIQTIRTYSRKVRRCSQTDADSTYRLLMSPTSPGLLPPSPSSMSHGHGHGHHSHNHNSHNMPPMSPTSPTSMTFDLGTGVSRSMTATSLTSNSSRRFWKLPKKIANNTRAAAPNLSLFTNFRSNSPNNGGSVNGSNPMSPTMGTSTPRLSTSGRRGSSRTDNHFGSSSGNNGGNEDQAKASGASLKRIFPTGSDYLCDALYAHIIAFNYISLLCPPPPSAAAEGASAEAGASAQPSSSAEPVTAAPTMTTLASSATLFEATQQQRRQTIRVYVGSDVPLPAMSDIGPSSSGDYGMRPVMELDEMHASNGIGIGNANTSSRLLSITSSRPPSRGYSNHCDENDDSRMISRKAALLLGITETLEPDTASIGGPSISNGHGRGHSRKGSTASGATAEFSSALPASIRGSSLARRYNSMRRRMAQSISESAEAAAAAAADPNDHTFAARAARAAAASKMIIKNLPSTMGAGNSNGSHTHGHGKSLSVEISKPIYEGDDAVSAIPTEGVPATVATTAASDASMRDLHAGLHACISQLVATMKLTTGQLGNTLLNTEAARAIDPLFLRTLCELVRSQEEQF